MHIWYNFNHTQEQFKKFKKSQHKFYGGLFNAHAERVRDAPIGPRPSSRHCTLPRRKTTEREEPAKRIRPENRPCDPYPEWMHLTSHTHDLLPNRPPHPTPKPHNKTHSPTRGTHSKYKKN